MLAEVPLSQARTKEGVRSHARDGQKDKSQSDAHAEALGEQDGDEHPMLDQTEHEVAKGEEDRAAQERLLEVARIEEDASSDSHCELEEDLQGADPGEGRSGYALHSKGEGRGVRSITASAERHSLATRSTHWDIGIPVDGLVASKGIDGPHGGELDQPSARDGEPSTLSRT